jgi:predicted SAM-dependent methyltransferase
MLFETKYKEWLRLRPNSSVLHFAPEPWLGRRLLKMGGIYYQTADLSGRSKYKFDITAVPLKANCFDMIYASHVLEHVEQDRKAMSELFRVAKPDGLVILQVPLYGGKTIEDSSIKTPEARLKAYGQADHVRKYGLDIVDVLSRAGFEVSTLIAERAIPSELREKYGIQPKSAIFECRKPGTGSTLRGAYSGA